ncbi:MAG: hypothetical protein L0H79_21455 [Intrasporangium sp.]|uniref:DUF6907 domain-containing protein n=1 Tax=Intrasporangium sp. TaxID=1925024 RepID=UPI00264A4258|nr:hypothetical protein [Intrasporangium sp.]MDN5798295.1 hypothetical protein [Intrasporangium sp.]
MSTIHADIFGTTANPCPTWCELGAGHGYDTNDHEAEYRFHERSLGDINEPIRDGGRLSVHVGIVASESLTLDESGTAVSVTPACIVLDAPDSRLTSSQAVEAARLLLAAAERLDAITLEEQ